MTYIYTHDIYVYEQKLYPPGKLTYPPTKAYLKMIFLLPRWDMLISWRVYIYIYQYISASLFVSTWHSVRDRPTDPSMFRAAQVMELVEAKLRVMGA